jgi:glutathione S-transferase
MKELRLLYFNSPGRAYVIRVALKIGGIPFEDNHLSFDELKSSKPSSVPLGSVPVLTVSI